jgi:hypothetical protein
MGNLREAITGTKVVMTDNDRSLTLAWNGGSGIHVYDDDGGEISYCFNPPLVLRPGEINGYVDSGNGFITIS